MSPESLRFWDSDLPPDPGAQEIRIDGNPRYVAFLRLAKDLAFPPGERAITSGNVITIPQDCDPDWFDIVEEHEKQHVIQHYDIDNFAEKYARHPAKYEMEAVARSILRCGLADRDPRFLHALRDDLVKRFKVNPAKANEFIASVLETRSYPGVTGPRY
jgi:hypothetical protein